MEQTVQISFVLILMPDSHPMFGEIWQITTCNQELSAIERLSNALCDSSPTVDSYLGKWTYASGPWQTGNLLLREMVRKWWCRKYFKRKMSPVDLFVLLPYKNIILSKYNCSFVLHSRASLTSVLVNIYPSSRYTILFLFPLEVTFRIQSLQK